jgi:hypothetical protein
MHLFVRLMEYLVGWKWAGISLANSNPLARPLKKAWFNRFCGAWLGLTSLAHVVVGSGALRWPLLKSKPHCLGILRLGVAAAAVTFVDVVGKAWWSLYETRFTSRLSVCFLCVFLFFWFEHYTVYFVGFLSWDLGFGRWLLQIWVAHHLVLQPILRFA